MRGFRNAFSWTRRQHICLHGPFLGRVFPTENSVQPENTEFTRIRETILISMGNSLFVALFALIASSFRTRAAPQAEILALRHQLAVLQANAPRPLRFTRSDRLLWLLLSRFWSGWRSCLQIVQPATVMAWHRRAFAWYWTRKSRRRPGRPEVGAEIRDLIRRMSQANPLWGEHHAFTESRSSWASLWRNRPWRSICGSVESRLHRLGGHS
jgi:hypothetical protein